MGDRVDIIQKMIKANIKKAGWHAMAVFGTPTESEFLYTIGLTERGWPELLVAGMPHRTAYSFVYDLVKRMPIADGTVITDLAVDDYPMTMRMIPEAGLDRLHREYVIQADEYYGKPVQVMQLVWSDRKRLFPWQPGSETMLHKTQCGPFDWGRLT